MKGWRLGQWAAWLWRHPSDSRLLALQDETTQDARDERTRAHLMRCAHCRTRAAQIAEDWKSLVALSVAANPATAFVEEELTENIRDFMHVWSAGNRAAPSALESQDPVRSNAGRQIAAILETYLGRRAAGVILRTGQSTSASGQANYAKVRQTLRVLLGCKNTAAMEIKILRMAGQFTKTAGRSSLG
jgi:hypothetical protein